MLVLTGVFFSSAHFPKNYDSINSTSSYDTLLDSRVLIFLAHLWLQVMVVSVLKF